MNTQRTLAVAKRIVQQFIHDRRTLGLMVVVPLLLLSILGALFKTTRVFEVGFVNQDSGVNTPLGNQKLSQEIEDSLKNSDSFVWQIKNLNDAEAELKNNSLDGYVLLGKNFSSDLLNKKLPTINIQLEGSDPNSSQQVLALINQNLTNLFASQKPTEIKVNFRYGGEKFNSLDYFAPVFIAFFAFFFVFLLTSVSFLRERNQGTFERIFASPVNNAELVVGYFLGFSLFALIQSIIVLLFTITSGTNIIFDSYVSSQKK